MESRTAVEARKIMQLTKDVTFDSATRSVEELKVLEDCSAVLVRNLRSMIRAKENNPAVTGKVYLTYRQ
jgi:hypothetical protein